MAEAKIDKSLDDIIKERKISGRVPRGGSNNNNRRGGGLGGGNRRGGLGAGGLRRGGPLGRRPIRGGILKRRSAGGPSPAKAFASAAASNGQWSHDLFDGAKPASNLVRRSIDGAQASSGSSKLVISNLDFGVNDQDIKGLFQEFGNLKKAAVHYDKSGRSLGTADVLFERRQDALKALKKYNGVSLDGRPMDIQLVAPLVAQPLSQRLSGLPRARPQQQQLPQRNGGGRPGGLRRGGRGGGAVRGGASARGGRGAKQTPKSAAELDAELDAYNSKMQTD